MKATESAISITNSATLLQRLNRNLVLKLLAKLEYGKLTLTDPMGDFIFGDSQSKHAASIRINNLDFYTLCFSQGSLGFGRAYIHHYWSTENLTHLIGIFATNLKIIERAENHFYSFCFKIFQSIIYICNPNDQKNAKKNILAHYDLSNDFFKLFLDEGMSYSSLKFHNVDNTLEQAARDKNISLLNKLELKPNDHLLEIGTGWGSLAIMAATEYNCQVTTTTISDQQHSYVHNLISNLKLENRIKLLNHDYRSLSGKYSKIISVEMIEAVGYKYFNQYFKICSDLLDQTGMLCIQAIVIRDQEYERAKTEVDFIKKYIFPGGCLPSIAAIMQSIKTNTDLSLFSLEDISFDYARTLRIWRSKFMNNHQQIIELGFDDKFIKMWDYYFSYCEAGFLNRNIMTVQLVFTKPGYRPQKNK